MNLSSAMSLTEDWAGVKANSLSFPFLSPADVIFKSLLDSDKTEPHYVRNSFI